MNSVFAQYEELPSPQFAVINLSLRLRLITANFGLDNSSYRAQPHSIIVKYYTSNSNCPIRKLSLCHVSMKLIAISRLTSSISEPAFLLTMFHPMFPGEHGVEHYSRRPRGTTRMTTRWVVNLSRAFCDPRPRSYQIMSAAQHLALINTIRIRARIIN